MSNIHVYVGLITIKKTSIHFHLTMHRCDNSALNRDKQIIRANTRLSFTVPKCINSLSNFRSIFISNRPQRISTLDTKLT